MEQNQVSPEEQARIEESKKRVFKLQTEIIDCINKTSNEIGNVSIHELNVAMSRVMTQFNSRFIHLDNQDKKE